MDKKKTKRKIKKNSFLSSGTTTNIILIIFTIGIVGVVGWFLYNFEGFNFPGFEGVNINIDSLTSDQIKYLKDIKADPSCTFKFDKSTALVGEDISATIKDGELNSCIVAYNYENTGWKIYNVETLDFNGELSGTQSADVEGTYVFAALCGKFVGEVFTPKCRTNDAKIVILPLPVIPPPDVPEVGDEVGSGSTGSGTGGFGDDFETTITMPWTTGGPFKLGVKIWRTWSYVNPSDTQCQLPEQYPMEWTLFDSNGMEWQKYDYVPVNNVYDEKCGLTYHEDAPWKFTVSVGISCPVNYNWRIQPYICGLVE